MRRIHARRVVTVMTDEESAWSDPGRQLERDTMGEVFLAAMPQSTVAVVRALAGPNPAAIAIRFVGVALHELRQRLHAWQYSEVAYATPRAHSPQLDTRITGKGATDVHAPRVAKPAHLLGKRLVGATGLEPVTPAV